MGTRSTDDDVKKLSLSLKPAPNQVAGHRFDEGRQGSLVDEAGRFYKPLQGGDRGDAEVAFYSRFWEDTNVPEAIRGMVPKFFGVAESPGDVVPKPGGVEAHALVDSTRVKGQSQHEHQQPSGAPKRFLVMEDLTAGYTQPCIIDVKMGRQTWYEGAPQGYIDKCLVKDAQTTSGALGFRIAGMQVYDTGRHEMWKADRQWCKSISAGNMAATLARFLSLDPMGQGLLDFGVAKAVLEGERGFLKQLDQLRHWMSVQTTYQFYSASVLIIFEGVPKSVERNVRLCLVDFAHVTERHQKDINFLEAIDALSSYLKKLLVAS